jgi:uncharacterized membrane protein
METIMRTFFLMLAVAGFALTSHRMYLDIFVELEFEFIHLLIVSWGCFIVAICLILTWPTSREDDTDEVEA